MPDADERRLDAQKRERVHRVLPTRDFDDDPTFPNALAELVDRVSSTAAGGGDARASADRLACALGWNDGFAGLCQTSQRDLKHEFSLKNDAGGDDAILSRLYSLIQLYPCSSLRIGSRDAGCGVSTNEVYLIASNHFARGEKIRSMVENVNANGILARDDALYSAYLIAFLIIGNKPQIHQQPEPPRPHNALAEFLYKVPLQFAVSDAEEAEALRDSLSMAFLGKGFLASCKLSDKSTLSLFMRHSGLEAPDERLICDHIASLLDREPGSILLAESRLWSLRDCAVAIGIEHLPVRSKATASQRAYRWLGDHRPGGGVQEVSSHLACVIAFLLLLGRSSILREPPAEKPAAKKKRAPACRLDDIAAALRDQHQPLVILGYLLDRLCPSPKGYIRQRGSIGSAFFAELLTGNPSSKSDAGGKKRETPQEHFEARRGGIMRHKANSPGLLMLDQTNLLAAFVHQQSIPPLGGNSFKLRDAYLDLDDFRESPQPTVAGFIWDNLLSLEADSPCQYMRQLCGNGQDWLVEARRVGLTSIGREPAGYESSYELWDGVRIDECEKAYLIPQVMGAAFRRQGCDRLMVSLFESRLADCHDHFSRIDPAQESERNDCARYTLLLLIMAVLFGPDDYAGAAQKALGDRPAGMPVYLPAPHTCTRMTSPSNKDIVRKWFISRIPNPLAGDGVSLSDYPGDTCPIDDRVFKIGRAVSPAEATAKRGFRCEGVKGPNGEVLVPDDDYSAQHAELWVDENGLMLRNCSKHRKNILLLRQNGPVPYNMSSGETVRLSPRDMFILTARYDDRSRAATNHLYDSFLITARDEEV